MAERFEEEEYKRVEGAFMPVNGGHEVGCEEADQCAPDDIVEDDLEDHGVPGTIDDLPYDYGVEHAKAADTQLPLIERPTKGYGDVGRTGEPTDYESGEVPELGQPEERELWRQQQPLMSESPDDEEKWRGLEGDDIPKIDDALGDNAAEVNPETAEGDSATGHR